MNYVGLFEGISGFGLAFKRAGAEIVAVCEINKDCQKVLRRHHPEAELVEDVKKIRKDSFAGRAIDVLAGGFPCQDLSVAGLRKGLDGERSGLWFEFIRIIADHRPRWVVIENVPGLLSSQGGKDFAIVLQGLVKCGYGVAWRVFDSQFDGVAQRRNRVFIVASLGTADACQILFESEGGAWDPAPSRETGQSITGTLSARTSAGGGLGADFDCAGGLVPHGHRVTAFGKYVDDGTSSTLKQRDYKNATDLIVQPQVAHALTSGGADASEDGTGRGTPIIAFSSKDYGNDAVKGIAPCLRSMNFDKSHINGGGQVAIAFAQNTRDELRYVNGDGQIAGDLAAEPGMKQQSYVMAFTTEQTPKYNEDCALTLTKQSPTGGGQVQSVMTLAFTERTRAEGRTIESQSELAYALTDASKGGNPHSGKIAGHFSVRRLTPTECERLQGFPDGWTAVGADGRPISDSARYRMLGNAVCVPTAEWIAKRIVKLEREVI